MKDDRELVAEALEGGLEAFGEIVDRYRDAVFGVSLSRLRNFHDAEDVAQTVFVEAFSKLDKFREPMKLGAWLRTIAIRRSIDLIRKRKEAVGIDEIERAEPEVGSGDLREQVLEAIGKLGKAQRETVTLYYINGYSVNEVAAMQESPAGTVKRRLHEARKKLKEEMMKTVEGVLKSEAPKADFGERVYELLTSHHPDKHVPWVDLKRGLSAVGTEGTEGFLRAFESPYPITRTLVIHMLQSHHFPHGGEQVMAMMKRGLADSNKKVRRAAIEALLRLRGVSDEVKESELVPLVVPLLRDKSKRVRRAATGCLRPWASAVPLKAVVDALSNEKDGMTAFGLRRLLKIIADGT